jgi:hypothetical protein
VGDRVSARGVSGVVLAALVGSATAAAAEPDDQDLVLAGLAMAPPTYFIGVVSHEGSHAIAAKLVGAEVTSISFLPGRDPATGAFHFGLTRVKGLRGKGEKVFFFLAPKIVDAALLGGFGALVLTDAWPENRYGQLALTVLATGFWVDFSKDVLAFRKSNDVVKVFDLWCMNTTGRQIAVRLAYTGAVAGFGYLVWRGYDRTFRLTDDPASPRTVMLPLVNTTF